MTTFTEGRYPGEMILSEASGQRSRDAIVIASGEGVVKPGTVMKRSASEATVSAATFEGTGNGGLTLSNPAFGAGVKNGAYRAVCIEPASDAGQFAVFDPEGVQIGVATVGVEFDGPVKFTIDDGGTDYVAGDAYSIPVSGAGYEYAVATDGDEADAVCLYGGDATSAAVNDSAIVRDAELNINILEYHSGVDNAAKKAALHASLAEKGIIVR